MPISNIPLFAMLRTRMQWHQERQRVLSENVANADTPGFRARDLVPPKFDRTTPSPARGVTLVRTDASHRTGAGSPAGGGSAFDTNNSGKQIRPTGNAVSLEEEMIKVAANQMDYQAATALYSRSLGLIKTALGRG
ncbi:MAG TPA: flagellar basal body rod protein FlgB [Xanthobacteraceae bacterium]|nr:flagellar basal body rod protein FlgB [Xanthobacteraceae bacterium]